MPVAEMDEEDIAEVNINEDDEYTDTELVATNPIV